MIAFSTSPRSTKPSVTAMASTHEIRPKSTASKVFGVLTKRGYEGAHKMSPNTCTATCTNSPGVRTIES